MKQPKGEIARVVFNPHNKELTEEFDNVRGVAAHITRKGKYAHYCYDWDEMLIDENDPEFEACTCGKPNPLT